MVLQTELASVPADTTEMGEGAMEAEEREETGEETDPTTEPTRATPSNR